MRKYKNLADRKAALRELQAEELIDRITTDPKASPADLVKALGLIERLERIWDRRETASKQQKTASEQPPEQPTHADRKAAEILTELEAELAQDAKRTAASPIPAVTKPVERPPEPPTPQSTSQNVLGPSHAPTACKTFGCDRPAGPAVTRGLCVHHSKHPRRVDPMEGVVTVGGADLRNCGLAVETGTWTPTEGYVSTAEQEERETDAIEAQRAEAHRQFELLGQTYRRRP